MDNLITETRDGDTWVDCRDCGRCNWISKGPVTHARSCRTRSQYAAPSAQPAPVAVASTLTTDELRAFGADVRRSSLTHGRDADVLAAVRDGHLSESDAMNTDD